LDPAERPTFSVDPVASPSITTTARALAALSARPSRDASS
jgi:hypothetical protein